MMGSKTQLTHLGGESTIWASNFNYVLHTEHIPAYIKTYSRARSRTRLSKVPLGLLTIALDALHFQTLCAYASSSLHTCKKAAQDCYKDQTGLLTICFATLCFALNGTVFWQVSNGDSQTQIASALLCDMLPSNHSEHPLLTPLPMFGRYHWCQNGTQRFSPKL